MSSVAFLGSQNAPKSFAVVDFPQTPTGGAYNAPPDPIAGFKGAYLNLFPT